MGAGLSALDWSKDGSKSESEPVEIPEKLIEFKQLLMGKRINIAIFIEHPMTIIEPYRFVITIKGNSHHIDCGSGYFQVSLIESTSLHSLKKFVPNAPSKEYKIHDAPNMFPYHQLSTQCNYGNNAYDINDDLQAKYFYFVEDVMIIPIDWEYTTRTGSKYDPDSVINHHVKKTFDIFLIVRTGKEITMDRILCKWVFMRSDLWMDLPTDLMNVIVTYLPKMCILQEEREKNESWFGQKCNINTRFAAIGIHNYEKILKRWEMSDKHNYRHC